ncbi:hypothetical protein ACPA54_04660 [Uniformispora flossi]|uniref:hypothetical protein n=1 Tax=Uniformispora flossi TaxID=3390723 RepID=UPI003C2AE3D3
MSESPTPGPGARPDPLRSAFHRAGQDAAAAARPLPVGEVTARGDRLRRRRTVGFAVAVCLVLGGVGGAVAALAPDGGRGPAAPPGGSPSAPPTTGWPQPLPTAPGPDASGAPPGSTRDPGDGGASSTSGATDGPLPGMTSTGLPGAPVGTTTQTTSPSQGDPRRTTA